MDKCDMCGKPQCSICGYCIGHSTDSRDVEWILPNGDSICYMCMLSIKRKGDSDAVKSINRSISGK